MNISHSLLLLAVVPLVLTACGGKYTVKSYPADAKLYVKDFKTNEKKLIGNTPAQIKEDAKLGDVFFLVLEKENYKPREIMVKVNEGESLAVAATLDPLAPGEGGENVAKKDDKDKPQGSPKKDEPPKDWQQEIADMKLRVALLENTAAFTKEALFSSRLAGGQPGADRDRRESVTGLVFQAQSNIAKGKLPEALEKIDKAIQLDEYAMNAWMLKGSVKYLQKDFQGARLAWEQTLKLDPYNQTVFKYLNNVYKMLNMDQMPENPASLRYPASNLEIQKQRWKQTQ